MNIEFDKTDVAHFKSKLDRETDPARQEKLKKQIELLEDAIVIYHEKLPPRYTDAERGELNLIYNPESINEDYIFPRSDDNNLRGSRIETLPTTSSAIETSLDADETTTGSAVKNGEYNITKS